MSLQEDIKQVMGSLLAVAQITLKQQGALTPFAVALTTQGEVLHLAGEDAAEPVVAIERLTATCAHEAAAGAYRAAAVAYDVRIEHPQTGEERDAIAVNFDHRENASVIYCLPYRIKGGDVELEQPLTQQGERRVFAKTGEPGTRN
ncbi:MAG: hypothetical protein COW30_15740 [Rhodospirillales bacterium CG15_BIG_FIL_POST_REV_8_21_14_020_66_15]|nr:MAG: hypothetical protein COW30_15740 [Rhodospirillales bacterium CG15_BIG_FIL_POST_REV_8_21_14_020_66_15]